MIVQELKKVFLKDLEKLKEEISLYPNEESLWRVEPGITNPGGNLCLHLIGNLKNYIGATMGNTGYVRNRDLEFSQKNIPQKDLVKMIEETTDVVSRVLSTVKDERLNEEYPLLVFKEKTSTAYFLIYMAGHLSYHLGQINYHRRLVASKV